MNQPCVKIRFEIEIQNEAYCNTISSIEMLVWTNILADLYIPLLKKKSWAKMAPPKNLPESGAIFTLTLLRVP